MGTNDIVKFTNWTQEEFIGMWDKEPEKFLPGKSKYMQRWRANHYAKHLANQVLNNKHLPTNHQTRPAILARCISEAEPAESQNTANVEAEVINKNKEADTTKVEEKEFPDLKDETAK